MGDVNDEGTKRMPCTNCGSHEVEESAEITTTVCEGCGHLVVRDADEAAELGLLVRMNDLQTEHEERSWALCAMFGDHPTSVRLARWHLALLRVERLRRRARWLMAVGGES